MVQGAGLITSNEVACPSHPPLSSPAIHFSPFCFSPPLSPLKNQLESGECRELAYWGLGRRLVQAKSILMHFESHENKTLPLSEKSLVVFLNCRISTIRGKIWQFRNTTSDFSDNGSVLFSWISKCIRIDFGTPDQIQELPNPKVAEIYSGL